ncbi:MAG: hypothetical protein WC817_00820 [Patescibacteria group bacterium]
MNPYIRLKINAFYTFIVVSRSRRYKPIKVSFVTSIARELIDTDTTDEPTN